MDVVHSQVGSCGTCTVLCTLAHSCGGLVIVIHHTPPSETEIGTKKFLFYRLLYLMQYGSETSCNQ